MAAKTTRILNREIRCAAGCPGKARHAEGPIKLYYTVWNKRPDHEKKADFDSPSKARTCDSKTASQRQYQGDARRLAQLRAGCADRRWHRRRSEEHTSELQSLMRISYAVFCLKKKTP